ncbi:MAG TPA: PilC/PilY family type IV pilus protein [Vicinamibacterales bacterium]|nr:PilC/PilY family type IV pilus protein [Vicinamibacterales bacterium]
MNSVKRLIALVVTATFLSLQVHPAVLADDSDIFGSNIQPNVVIMIDDSGSMGDSAPSNSFDVPPPNGSASYYPVLNNCDPSGKPKVYVSCDSLKVYKSGSSNGTYTSYANTVSAVTGTGSAAAQTALNSAGYWSGKINGSSVNLFTGNYLNYLLGTCANGGACSKPKMDIAKEVINGLLDSVQGVRFGVMTFHYDSTGNGDGAKVIAQVGSSVSSMKAAVNNLAPTGNTPLGDALYDVGQYYKGLKTGNNTQGPFTSPIQLECQPNFVIFITDGMQTAGTRLMPAEATNRYTQDHASALTGTQNVIVHTVGFGVTVNTTAAETQAAYDTLSQSAKNGGGQFYISDDETALQRALQDAIRRIVQATFTFATPVVPTTSTTGSTKAYLAAFRSDPSSPFWRGYLKAYQRDSSGLVPVDANGVPLSSALVWEAGQVLSTTPAANRNIYTFAGGARQAFTKGNSAITQALLGASSSTERDNIIDFTRGIDAYDENGNGNVTEERAWKLGDIFHSTPVLVTPPVLALNDSSYQAFKTSQASRTKVLIAGANDGMIHAFRESDGVELWAFIPPDLLDNLKTLTDTGGDHQFFVDSSPIATDVKISGTWKTIVVFGMRRGGPFYYALDITDTTNPQWLWKFTDSKIAETWSEPSMGKVKIGTTDTFVAFFGGGYDTASNNAHGKAFFVVDLSNGTKLWEYYNNGTSDDRQYMNFSLSENSTAVDLDNNGYVDHVYVGDVGGQLWKFDVSANATASWAGKRLFTAAPTQTNPPAAGEWYPTQAFYGAPVLAYDTSMHLWVFLGTGDRNHPNSTSSNRFYGIKDTTDMSNAAALSESSLFDVTSTNGTAAGGWFFRLASNEKVLDPANVFNSDVLFSSFTPTSVVTCSSGGGTAKLYSVQMTSGYAAIDFSTGAMLTTTDSSVTRSTTIGQGIASMPVVIVTPPQGSGMATASAITATTNQQLPSNPIPAPAFLKQVRSWRERIQ